MKAMLTLKNDRSSSNNSNNANQKQSNMVADSECQVITVSLDMSNKTTSTR